MNCEPEQHCNQHVTALRTWNTHFTLHSISSHPCAVRYDQGRRLGAEGAEETDVYVAYYLLRPTLNDIKCCMKNIIFLLLARYVPNVAKRSV